jgi:putative endonuclease
MGREKQKLGKIGEDYACEYLKGKGYKILARNVHIGRGEIDIVAQKGNLIVFIEVKTRRSDEYVDILDSIDEMKEEALITSCEEYLAKNKLEDCGYRIDLIGIVMKDGIVEKFEHVEGVI